MIDPAGYLDPDAHGTPWPVGPCSSDALTEREVRLLEHVVRYGRAGHHDDVARRSLVGRGYLTDYGRQGLALTAMGEAALGALRRAV